MPQCLQLLETQGYPQSNEQAAARMNECPLGSGALAGNPFGIDREALSDSLGFARPVQNSIDAVSDRDFVAELSFWAAMLQVHHF